MFKLEKVFQNDDKGFILFTEVIKTLFIFFSIYIFAILESHSIYQLFNYDIFINSNYFQYGVLFPIIFFYFACQKVIHFTI